MANALDTRNKNNSLQRAQAGSTVVKELRSASSGFSLSPESRPSAAAVEAENHNPKVAGKKQKYGDQIQSDGKEEFYSPKQFPDAHNEEFQDQLRASTPEAMPKNFPIASSHSRYSDFFRNTHDGGGFATDVVTMGGPVERPIEMRTSAIVLEFSLTHAPFAVSLQYAMVIIPKRSQEETFSALEKWVTFINHGKAQDTIEEAVVDFAADTSLEVRRKTRLDGIVSLVAPGVEVQTDRTWTLPERGQMKSTTGSHGSMKRYRGVHSIYYALLDGQSGTEVLQKHPHHPIGSCGAWDGGVILRVSMEAGKHPECSSPHDVRYEPGRDAPCVYVRTKSYSDTHTEELVMMFI
jgi:hypothetical protein